MADSARLSIRHARMPNFCRESCERSLICSGGELDYRLRRRWPPCGGAFVQLAFGDYVLDGGRRELRRGSEQVALEPQVFDVLLYLALNRDRVVSKDDLIAAVWNGRAISESTLTSRIAAARKAVSDSGERQALIKTYARRGFRFVGDIRIDATADAAGAPPTRARTVPEGSHPPANADSFADQAPGPASSGAALSWGGRPAVAVLPFKNLSGDPEQEYFSDGITEDIIAALSKYRSLAVIARNSSFAFKDAGGDVRQVGLTLGGDYLVEGSVRKIGQRVRVTAQLVETEGGRQLWAERYDRDLENLFALQDEITIAIAARIEPEIGAAERLRVERKAVPTLHAWDYFRLGTKHFYRSTAADNLEAQRLFHRAIELDPSLAEAYGFLSYALVLSMVYFEADPSEERLDEAVTVGRKGVELDDQDGLLRFMYGRALLARKAYGDALAELETAVALNPYLAVSYCGLGDTLAYEGRISEAIPYFQKAIDLSPYDPLRWAFCSYRALAHIFAREFELAFDWAQRATRVPNAHYWAFAHCVSALGHLERPEELGVATRELLQRKPDFSCSFARKRLFYVKSPEQLELYVEGLRRAGIPA
jgi:TolB-like protein/DNA-binding winged helix-turn-helix (wHTH) protein/Tfp pilus assembly protein PilF